MFKRKSAALLAIAVLTASASAAYAAPQSDNRIFSDPVQNTYVGRPEASQMIANLSFNDVPGGFWAAEAIARTGAFNMVKGYDNNYSPNAPVTNQEAVAFVLRVIGQEQNAQNRAVTTRATLPETSPLRDHWAIGYLNLAMELGLLTRAQYNDATAGDQAMLDPVLNFRREAPATREQVADWLVRGLEIVNPAAFATTATQQSLYNFPDWDQTDVAMARPMEAALQAGIFRGDSNGLLRPKGTLTRAEMAQVLRNMDSVYYNMSGLAKKAGTVGGIKDGQTETTGFGMLTRDFYIRDENGQIDILRYSYIQQGSQTGDINIVTTIDGKPTTVNNLAVGDQIEYIVGISDPTAYYVEVVNRELQQKDVLGTLKSVDTNIGLITVTSGEKDYSYVMLQNLYGVSDNGTPYVVINNVRRSPENVPIGSAVTLTLKNNVAETITYVGEPTVVTEDRGIIISNDPMTGTLTYFDRSGNIVTKYYYENDIKVKKQKHFNRDDQVGYISEMFPHFKYNPLETTIDQVEPGDIVFMRFADDDPDAVVNISASVSYLTKYGKIKQYVDNGEYASVVITYENGETSWFDIPNDVFLSKDGRPITSADVKDGDWCRLLINQAILEPGSILESVKEMAIEGDEHSVTTIVKGQLAGLNPIQNELQIQNAQTLSKTGWSNYQNIAKFSLTGRDIEYYYDNRPISLDYATQYLKRASGEVYLALEKNYAGDKVKKVTFRTGRDELLPADTVVSTDGAGGFTILSNDGAIATDEGTIIRRHGRLVDGVSIMAPDYAVVSLNGAGKAAVVDILEAPDTSQVLIIRGRIDTVDDGKSFKVFSMATLSGNAWNYTPVEREFTIDYNTVFIGAGGVTDDAEFLSYGDTTVHNKVYNIVVTGSHADRVIDAPYATKAVRGTIYEVSGGTAKIKNATYYETATGKWQPVSETNAILEVTFAPNTIIAKNNALMTAAGLQKGDVIKAMTNVLADKPAPGSNVDAYVVHVEK